MTQKFRKISQVILLLLTLIVVESSVLASQVSAQTKAWNDYPNSVCVGGPDNDVATIQGLQCLIGNVLSVAITVIGLAGFVMLIYGSFIYMTSGGQSKGAETARNTLTYAIVGLIVALSSFFILNIIASFTGVNTIMNFSIPDSDSNLNQTQTTTE